MRKLNSGYPKRKKVSIVPQKSIGVALDRNWPNLKNSQRLKMLTVRQKSVGIIVFRLSNGRREYLLMRHGRQYWNFPKGRQESGEKDRETAFRELAEETGLTQVRLVPRYLDSYRYKFSVLDAGRRKRIDKVAFFYLGHLTRGEVRLSDEHIGYGWFSYRLAESKLIHGEIRALLKRANAFLTARG